MKITVLKYDPAVDNEPYYVDGEVEYTEKMTLLEAIISFHENCGEVAFDYSCHGRMCGRCAVMLDGEPKLACCTPITDEAHVIEPLGGLTVIRDLIVDKGDLDAKLSEEYRRVRIEPITEEEVGACDGATAAAMYEMVACLRCGMCNVSCPVYTMSPDEYVGPAMMLAVAYRQMDPYDQSDRVLEAVSKGLYRCIQCGMCDETCQRYEIDHQAAWKRLRVAAEERGLVPSYAK